VSALDLMGNRLEGETISVTDLPVYLLSRDENVWKSMFASSAP
jgi:hypothetical protein